MNHYSHLTGSERPFPEGVPLVSKTDLDGVITYVNPLFSEFSGFTDQEMLGAKHNLLRHPDVPAVVYTELWQHLKADRPWSGILKNRCKNGDFYWVKAQIAPLREHGRMVGYMATRTRPTPEDVRQAESYFRDLRERRSQHKSGTKFNFFRRLRVWQKFLTIGIAMAVPLALAIGLLAMEINEKIRDDVIEQRGLAYVVALRAPLEHLQQHRGMSSAFLNGDTSFKPRMLALEERIKADFQHLSQVEAEKGAGFTTAAPLAALTTRWQSLREQVWGMTAPDSFSNHTDLISALLKLIRHVEDGSGLVLNSQLDIYYLMDVVVNRIPPLTESMGQSRAKGSGAAAKRVFLPGQREQIISLLADTKVNAKAMTEGLAIAVGYNSHLKESIEGRIRVFDERIATFQALVEQGLLGADGITVNAKEVFDSATTAITAAFDIFDSATPALVELLDIRFNTLATRLYGTLGTVALFLLVAILIGLVLARAITRPLSKAAEIFDRIGDGCYENDITVVHHDEIGHLLDAIKIMQVKLGFDMSEARRASDENLRIRHALDHVSTGVIITDSKMQVLYSNPAVTNLFTAIEGTLRTHLPSFDSRRLVRTNLAEIVALGGKNLDLETNSGRHSLSLAGRHFDLVANPVVNHEGVRLGSVVEWTDVTTLRQTQGEVEGMVRAADAGDLGQRLELAGKEGFFYTLAEALNRLLNTVEDAVTSTVRALESMAKGDFTARIDNNYDGAFARIRDHLNETTHQLGVLVGSIRTSAQSIESASQEIATGNADLSRRTEQQAASLEETGATMEELTSTVKQNAANAEQANQFAQGAREVAERGGELMGEVVSTMGSITESSAKIADIITVIDGIAFQTNILALNAAVEAARAGEQGLGFSVVATEVRNLAQRSATAAREIKGLIGTSSIQVSNGSRLVEQAGQAMNEIVQAVKRVTDLMAEISAASKEQSEGIEQVNQAVSQMDEATQQNAALVEEATAAAEGLTEQAQELRMAVDVFHLDPSMAEE
ncbi:methyl-accepting chemotaxis protein [Gammaproteobacteria bacterium]